MIEQIAVASRAGLPDYPYLGRPARGRRCDDDCGRLVPESGIFHQLHHAAGSEPADAAGQLQAIQDVIARQVPQAQAAGSCRCPEQRTMHWRPGVHALEPGPPSRRQPPESASVDRLEVGGRGHRRDAPGVAAVPVIDGRPDGLGRLRSRHGRVRRARRKRRSRCRRLSGWLSRSRRRRSGRSRRRSPAPW